MKTRVAILGSTGMLGYAMVDAFCRDDRFETFCFARNSSLFSQLNALDLGQVSNIRNVDYVINCMGIIKQRKNISNQEMYGVNAVFPWALQGWCQATKTKLIQVSTDCVFSGKGGNYNERDTPDPIDDYGTSKLLGEPNKSMVIRASVIGREIKNKLSFLEWALSSHGKTVNGFASCYWNGLTSQEYASACKKIVANGLYDVGTFHVFSDVVSKLELLSLVNKRFTLSLQIEPDHQLKIDRSLSTVHSLCKELSIPSIERMISELL